MNEPEISHRSGYVALVGRPNVGKSTLLNAICGEKIAAVSEKPETTRNRILGVKTRRDAQIIFMDTPGIHEAHSTLNQYMVQAAMKALDEVDVIYFMVDFPAGKYVSVLPADAAIAELLKSRKRTVFLVANKTDLFHQKQELLPWIDAYSKLGDFAEIFPIAARKKDGLSGLEKATIERLPFGPQYFPPDQYTDQPERFLAAEIVREKIFRTLSKELPYASAVTVEAWTETEPRIEIEATIHVERDSQKAIVIGKGGQTLKKIGTDARLELERMLGTRVHLALFVRVEPNWRKDPRSLRKLGYEAP